MKKERPTRPLSPAAVKQHLQPYAIEIGELSLAWNRLHDHFGQIFWAALGPDKGSVAFAIWNRLANDRTQRDILKVAVEAGGILQGSDGRRGTDDTLWLIKEANTLAELRNNAIHAPMTTLTNVATGITRVAPQDFYGNPRAKRLAAKPELLGELAWYRACAECLDEFSVSLSTCIAFPAANWPWPDRPKLPARGQAPGK
jgi:hypothetical protein